MFTKVGVTPGGETTAGIEDEGGMEDELVVALTADWKLGRRSSGGITGGTTETVERCVLVDVWLKDRLRGRFRNALCADDVDCAAVQGLRPYPPKLKRGI